MARRRNHIPSISEINLYFANNMLIAFCVQPPAIFLHSGGKARGKTKDKTNKSTEACDISIDTSISTSIRLRAYGRTKANSKENSFCFVFVNLRGKFILCYFAYAYVASENQAKVRRRECCMNVTLRIS